MPHSHRSSFYSSTHYSTISVLTRLQSLQEVWGGELSRNINADEAGALGAVYRSADMGQGFKVKTFHVKECNLYPIQVDFERAEVENVPAKVISRSLFTLGNAFPQKKVMSFNKHTSDFSLNVR